MAKPVKISDLREFDIADYLGLTIETVSRTINQMQRDHHLVIVPDGVRLLDLNYFNALAPT